MSGFARGTDHGPYELLGIKLHHWHSHRRDDCRSTEEIIDRHLRAHFTVEPSRSGSYWITGPTLEAGSTNLLYTALSGYESNEHR